MVNVSNNMLISQQALIQINKELINKRSYKKGILKINGSALDSNGLGSNLSLTNYFTLSNISIPADYEKVRISFSGVFEPTNLTEDVAGAYSFTGDFTTVQPLSVNLTHDTLSVYYKGSLLGQVKNLVAEKESDTFITLEFTREKCLAILYTNKKSYQSTFQLSKPIPFHLFTDVQLGLDVTTNNYWKGVLELPAFALYVNDLLVASPSVANQFKFTKILVGDGTYPLTDTSTPINGHIYLCPVNEVAKTNNNVLLTATIDANAFLTIKEIALYYDNDSGSHIFSMINGLNVKKEKNLGYSLILHVKLDLNVVNTTAFPEIAIKDKPYSNYNDFKAIDEVVKWVTINLERIIKLNALGIGNYAESTMQDKNPVGVGYNTDQVLYRLQKEIELWEDNFTATNRYAQAKNRFTPRTQTTFNKEAVKAVGPIIIQVNGDVSGFYLTTNPSYVVTEQEFALGSGNWEVNVPFSTNDYLGNQSIFSLNSFTNNTPLKVFVEDKKLKVEMNENETITGSFFGNSITLDRGTTLNNVDSNDYIVWNIPYPVLNNHYSITGTLNTELASEGVISGTFSQSNYIKSSIPIDKNNHCWELVTAFTTGDNGSTVGSIVSTNNYGMTIVYEESKFKLYGSSNGTSWNVMDGVSTVVDTPSTITLLPNTKYYIKLRYHYDLANHTYYLYVSPTGAFSGEETLVVQANDKTYINLGYLYFGTSNISSFSGSSIDMSSVTFAYDPTSYHHDPATHSFTNIYTGAPSITALYTQKIAPTSAADFIDEWQSPVTTFTFNKLNTSIIAKETIIPLGVKQKYNIKIKKETGYYKVYVKIKDGDYNLTNTIISSKEITNVLYPVFGADRTLGSTLTDYIEYSNPFHGTIHLGGVHTSTETLNASGIVIYSTYSDFTKKETLSTLKLLDFYHIPEYSASYYKAHNLGMTRSSYIEAFEGALTGFSDQIDFADENGFSLLMKVYLRNNNDKIILTKGNTDGNRFYFIFEQLDSTLVFTLYLYDVTVVLKKPLTLLNMREFTDNPMSIIITFNGNMYAPIFKMYKNNTLLNTVHLGAATFPAPQGLNLTNYLNKSEIPLLNEQIVQDVISVSGELKEDDLYYINNLMDTNF